jgi:hypothetical protein
MYQDAKVWRLCRYRHKRHSFISALAQTQTPDATIRHQRSPQSENAGTIQPRPAGSEATGGGVVELAYWAGPSVGRWNYQKNAGIASPSPQKFPQSPRGNCGVFFNCMILMVGTGRFELPTPRTPSECSTRLSHVPTQSSRLRGGGCGVSISLHQPGLVCLHPAGDSG